MYLYLGDDDMTRAASYLCGVMLYHHIAFERVDSLQSPSEDQMARSYEGYILSDYPKSGFRPGQLERIRDAVDAGSGLLMLGGWESYHGQIGEYNDTVLAEVLPVLMQKEDDRCNYAQPTLLYMEQSHPILDNLPWEKPPFVGGFNRFTAKPDARTILKAICTEVRITGEDESRLDPLPASSAAREERLSVPLPNGAAMSLNFTEDHPMLVVGRYGRGRTAALATDVAPHWVGGLVDWGTQRMTQKLPNGLQVEVGADYARFFAQLVLWTGGQGPV